MMKKVIIFCIFSVFWPSTNTRSLTSTYCIRHYSSGLVLDTNGSQNVVTLQHYSDSDSSMWRSEEQDPGVYLFVNTKNEEALEIRDSQYGGDIITNLTDTDAKYQQWRVNADGSIVSAFHNLTVTVNRKNRVEGEKLIAWPKDNTIDQIFYFQDLEL